MIDLLLRLLARLLPPLARPRYLEEWRADLAGAAGLGLQRHTVVLGAAALTATIDRDLPAHTGEPVGARPRRLARRGASMLAAGAAIGLGAYFTGGGVVPEPGVVPPAGLAALFVTGRVVLGIGLAVAALGVLLLIGASVAAQTVLARVALAAAVVGPVLAAAGMRSTGGAPEWMFPAGLLLTLAALVCGIVVLAGSPPFSLLPRSASRRQRLPLAVALVVVLLAVVVLGGIDLMVWNPLAKVPATDLATIYRLMADRDGFRLAPTVVALAGWAMFWAGAGVLVLVGACIGRTSPFTPRRIAILLLGIIGAAIFFRFFAGFGIGMSIADSFGTDGGERSLVSAVLPYIGQLALAGAAVAFGWAPRVSSMTPRVASAEGAVGHP